jgi:hypothetical protein
MSPEFEQIRSKRAFLIPVSVAVAAAISACGGGMKTETVYEPGQVKTIHEAATPPPVHHPKKHNGPTVMEEVEEEIEAEELEEAEGELEATPGGAEVAPESSHYSHGSHSSHSSHSSHVSSYGGSEYGGGHVSHSSHSSHSSHYSSG